MLQVLALEAKEKRALLEVARRGLAYGVSHGEAWHPDTEGLPADSSLRQPAGVFVSLHTREGELRGCVGALCSAQPLAETTAEMALAAASRDVRFPPVQEDEVDDLTIEVSVLGPLEPVHALDELVIGRDGLLARGEVQRGVLLPQVAEEHGWDAETFASQTCVKAGLPPDAWIRGDAELYRFSAEVISEA